MASVTPNGEPTTAEVRKAYTGGGFYVNSEDREYRAERFDRWLSGVRAMQHPTAADRWSIIEDRPTEFTVMEPDFEMMSDAEMEGWRSVVLDALTRIGQEMIRRG